MAGTRTVHRGSRGRFAGASGGKAEQVKVGRGYSRSVAGTKVSQHPPGLMSRSKAARTRYAAHQAFTHTLGSKAPGKVKAVRNLAVGVAVGGAVGYAGGKALGLGARAIRDRHTPTLTTHHGLGVGRREVVGMPRSALRHDATVGGRSVKTGAFVGQVGKAAREMTGTKVKKSQPNYNLNIGKKEYVGRRLKPGEGRGFKLAGA